MRILPLAILLLSLTALLATPRTSAADFVAEPGFTLLFSGRNLDGWQTAKTAAAESLRGKTEAFGGRDRKSTRLNSSHSS